MASPFGRLSLVVNLEAGSRRRRSAVDHLERELARRGLDYEVHATEGPGHASAIARRCLDDGGRFVVAVGGDGTVHEVVNGMVAGDRAAGAGSVLGVVAAGSGCDFIRTFGLPADPRAAAGHLDGAAVRSLDVARIGFVDRQGRPATRFFANIAEAGLGASTARRASTLPRFLGPSRYLVAFWAVLPAFRPTAMRVEVDGVLAYEGRAVNVVAANARFFGGGMHISPSSDPGDGVMELLVLNGRKTDSFTMLPRVYRGRHLPHPSIVELQGRRVRLEPEEPMAVEADGEVLGTTPVTVEMLPHALTVKV